MTLKYYILLVSLSCITISYITGMSKIKRLFVKKKNVRTANQNANDILEIKRLFISQLNQVLEESPKPERQRIEQLIKEELSPIFSS